ncbi:glycosyltransferase family 4 protein, partial [Salipiger mucosus]|uniref:glycosyltransferase family 4 protein n=1 Tax=Salipiger mucosus TaxID=263378 RepID=UPI00055D9612
MKVTWSIPAWGEGLGSTRGDMVRARHLIEALRRAGHVVQVVERASGAGASRTSAAMVAGYRGALRRMLPRPIALALRDISRQADSRAFGKKVARAAQDQGAEVIVETQMNCAVSGAVAARMTGLPLVLDDCSPSSEEAEIGSGLPGLAHRLLMSQAEAAPVVVATSNSVRDRLIAEGVPEDKLRLVRNGVTLEAFDAADREALRARLGLGDRCVFGFVGSFLDWHRVDLLIEALALLPRDLPAHVLLVGKGPQLEAVLAQAAELGLSDRVTSVGAVPPEEVPDYMAAFDVGVLPDTLDYGNPMKLTEYAAAAIPAVGPDRPSVREVVQHERTGLLFAPQDARALASCLSRLASDPELRARLGARARKDVAAPAAW